MARTNLTREYDVSQKKGVCVMVIPFKESEILVDGSVYGVLPERSLVMAVTSRVSTASSTANATLDVVADGTVLVDEMDVATANITDETLVAAARYLPTGGEVVLRAGATTPAAGDLVGELVIEYIELDKNTGEYTVHLSS